MRRLSVPGLLALSFALLAPSPVRADTLFLKNGKTMKIDALACNEALCVASFDQGDFELRAIDVVRVEPDEEVDPEPVAPVSLPRIGAAMVPRTIEDMVTEAARRYALPKSLVRAVAKTESGLNPVALSPKGAQGVMQLMPGTARDLGVQNAFDPAENIDAGARLLRQLLEKYQGRVAEALAAYNAGAGAVAKHRGVPPYRETRDYIRRVVRDYEKAEKAAEKSQAAKSPSAAKPEGKKKQ